MKHFIRTIVCLLAIVICQQMHAGQSLAAYQGNAHVHLLLFDTDSPGKIIESVSIDADSDYRYLGNPTNIAFFDSPPKMLAYAVQELLAKLSSGDQRLKNLQLDHFGVFVAGYEVFAPELVCLKAEGYGYADEYFAAKNSYAGAKGKCLPHNNGVPVWLESKEDYFWRTFYGFNYEFGQTIKARHMFLKGDHHLITQAARVRMIREQDTYEFIPDIDVVHTTTCAPGYQIRDGLMVEGSSVAPDILKDGGFHQVGRDVCSMILKAAPGSFTIGKTYDNLVLNALSALPVAREYARHRNDSILNRWKKGFSNELGIAITMVLKEAALPENDEDINSQIQEELIPLIVGGGPSKTYATLQAVAQSIQKLVNKGHVILPDGKKSRIRLLGEFPWDELGLKSFFRDELPAETYSRLEFIIAQDYEPMLAIAAAYIYQHPELFKEDVNEGADE